jgi:hypothetical protein
MDKMPVMHIIRCSGLVGFAVSVQCFGNLTGARIVVGSRLRYPIGSQTLIRRLDGPHAPVFHTEREKIPGVKKAN